MEYLLEQGVDIEQENNAGETALAADGSMKGIVYVYNKGAGTDIVMDKIGAVTQQFIKHLVSGEDPASFAPSASEEDWESGFYNALQA